MVLFLDTEATFCYFFKGHKAVRDLHFQNQLDELNFRKQIRLVKFTYVCMYACCTQQSSPVGLVEDTKCGTHHLKGTQPQLIKKSSEYKSNREPSMKNAQHNTHTHENDKLRVRKKPVKF